MQKLFPVGKILKAHGVQGQLKVHFFSGQRGMATPGLKLWFSPERPFGEILDLKWLPEKNNQSIALCRFTPSLQREEIQLIHMKTLYADERDFPALPDGYFHYKDLLGLKLVSADGSALGEVEEFYEVGDSVVIKAGSIELPFQPTFMKSIDWDKRVATVERAEWI